MTTNPTNPNTSPEIDISEALRQYAAWLEENDLSMEESPECFWVSVDQSGHKHGIDVQFDINEDSEDGTYAAWVYPNRMGQTGHLETDTQTCLAKIDQADWVWPS